MLYTLHPGAASVTDHPLALGGSSAVERGPWHYGADYVSVYFKGERAKLRRLVPKPYEVGDGTGVAYVCEIVSVAENAAEMVSTHPDRTLYREAALGVACVFAGRPGVFYPVMWVTTEWSLLRGLVNGYQKRLAEAIVLTRRHPLNPGLNPAGPGTTESGFCVKGGERVLSLSVTVKRRGEPDDLPSFGSTYGMRYYPASRGSRSSVSEPVEMLKSNSRASGVLLGDGKMQTVLETGKTTMTGGAVYSAGFTISGASVLAERSKR
jgi:acetoacetate decarboxylase